MKIEICKCLRAVNHYGEIHSIDIHSQTITIVLEEATGMRTLVYKRVKL